jgi:hypothetical protein
MRYVSVIAEVSVPARMRSSISEAMVRGGGGGESLDRPVETWL